MLLLMAVVGCKKKAAPAPPPEVQVITLTPTNVPIFEEWIGTLDGFVNAQIHAQVTGYLLAQNYHEGSEVKKGDLLFQIDPRPFQAGRWTRPWPSWRRTRRRRAKRKRT